MKDTRVDLFIEPTSHKHDRSVLAQAEAELAKSRMEQPAWWSIYLRTALAGGGLVGLALLLRRTFNQAPSEDILAVENIEVMESYAESHEQFESLDSDEDFELIANLEEIEEWEES